MAKGGEDASIGGVQPKLRMVANGSDAVNAVRAEHAAAVQVNPKLARRAPRRTQESAPEPGRVRREDVRVPKLRAPQEVMVSAFVRLTRDVPESEAAKVLADPKVRQTARKANLVTAEMPVTTAVRLGRDNPAVAHVELGQPLDAPTPKVEDVSPSPPAQSVRRFGQPRRHGFGEKVLIGLIDVGGFDFAHPDFLDRNGETRFARIWDQGGGPRPHPKGFDYGSEIDRDQMNAAIRSARAGGLSAQRLEPQSQMSEGSHATHVASIAAGNRGVARRAVIAGVLVSIPDEDSDRRLSFYDSSRIAHGVDYLVDLADELGLPVSINISLGTNGHAHDDSSAVGRWIDAVLTRPGRSVCVAAGNAGQERAETPDDMGFVMGRVHAGGSIPARGLVSDLEWVVVGNTVADISENELEIWYGAQDRFAVQVKPPGEPFTAPVEPGQYIENRQLSDGSFLSVYNELYHPANGCNYVSVYLSPNLLADPVVGVQAGQWLVRLHGREVRDGDYHAWIERDDPRRVGKIGDRDAWVFPSFFSARSFVDRSTVSSLACGQRVVSVANLDEAKRRIAATSSQGPTRDDRQKPEVAAPGTEIVAAKGFSATPNDAWVAMSGTSMASPHVAGVIGLMLAINPELTGAQVGGIVKRTAQPLPGTDFTWRDDAGAGSIDPEEAMEEAWTMRDRRDVTKPAP